MTSLPQDKNIQLLVDKIPLLANAAITKLQGGLTNINYRIETANAKYVMRVSNEGSALLGITRENEEVNTARAHIAGVGAAIAASLPAENVMVVEWVEAATLHAENFQADALLLRRVAAALKLLHSGPAFQGKFYFPDVRKKYLQLVLKNNYFLPDLYLDIEPLIIELENLLAVNPEPLVPCNNDLLAENFMDDGKKIWIIDYEYAGQNEASFDIGNLAGECMLTDAQLSDFCDVYWQRHLPEKIARARAWSMVARYGWVLWASIQEAVSPISFNFRAWGKKKWDNVLKELKSEKYIQVIQTLKDKG